jgi:hypothetical protein
MALLDHVIRDERPVVFSDPVQQVPVPFGEQTEIADMHGFVAALVCDAGQPNGQVFVDQKPGPNGQADRPGLTIRLDRGDARGESIFGLPRRGRTSAYSFAASSFARVRAG